MGAGGGTGAASRAARHQRRPSAALILRHRAWRTQKRAPREPGSVVGSHRRVTAQLILRAGAFTDWPSLCTAEPVLRPGEATGPGTLTPPPLQPAMSRITLEPLSRDRFLVKLAASRAMKEKLELARNLISYASPGGDLTVVLERAVDLLIADLQKRKLGQSSGPQTKPRSAKNAHVTRAARRKVLARDGFRCSFVAADGRRCNAQAFLELDHEHPKGCGGGSEPENIRLLCREHNRWAAEQVYGTTRIARAIAHSRGRLDEHLGLDRSGFALRPCLGRRNYGTPSQRLWGGRRDRRSVERSGRCQARGLSLPLALPLPPSPLPPIHNPP